MTYLNNEAFDAYFAFRSADIEGPRWIIVRGY